MSARLRFASYLLLLIWLGSLICVSFIVAPMVFDFFAYPGNYVGSSKVSLAEFENPRALAGSLVGSLLGIVNVIGLVAAPLLVALELWRSSLRGSKLSACVCVLIAMAILCYGNFFVLTPMIESVRGQMPAVIDRLNQSDPLRQRFGRLHGISVLLALLQILLGFAVVWLWSRDESAK
ncbi:MAG: DUF4149 domain-containing protein [bacterium]